MKPRINPLNMKKKIYLFFTTHWDREWYQPFQEFRFRLVEMVDQLLLLFKESPDLPPFIFDGQYIVLDDYLEIRPHNRDRLLKLIREKKIVLGPWYTMPDEIIISGESLIRNLEKGIKSSIRLGSVNRCGYVCDMFGHNSQMPQIFKLCGLDSALLWRGVPLDRIKYEFLWQAADGTMILTHAFSMQKGYGSTWLEVVSDFKQYGREIEPAEAVKKMLNVIREREEASPAGSVLLQMGIDHCSLDREVYEFLDYFNSSNKEYEIVFSRMETFFDEYPDCSKLMKVKDELRTPCGKGQKNYLIPHVGSSRIDQKQKNSYCESLLCSFAEPYSLFCTIENSKERFCYKPFIEKSWEYLMKNHAHDSICGCSVDQVHKDMEYRFDQARLIAELIVEEVFKRLNRSNIKTIIPYYGIKRIRFYNGAGRDYNGPIDFSIDFIQNPEQTAHRIAAAADLPVKTENNIFRKDGIYFHHEEFYAFAVKRIDGEEVPFQLLSIEKNRSEIKIIKGGIVEQYPVERYNISCQVHIPSFGYSDLFIIPGENVKINRDTLFNDSSSFENEYIKVEVTANGTLTIRNKETQKTYCSCLEFLITADIGDGYIFHKPVNGMMYSSKNCLRSVSIKQDGPLKAVLELKYEIRCPIGFDYNYSSQPSPQMADEEILVDVILHKGEKQVEFKARVINRIEQFRLQVLFPTEINSNTYFIMTPFDVAERDIFHEKDYEHNEPYPDYGIGGQLVFIRDNKDTAALLLKGLPEAGVISKEDRPLAITLMRSTNRTAFTSGEKTGLLEGEQVFEFAFSIHDYRESNAALVYDSIFFNNKPKYNQKDFSAMTSENDIFAASSEKSYIVNNSDFIITAVKEIDGNRFIIRGFNPSDQAVAVELQVNIPFSRAYISDLLSERKIKDIEVKENGISFKAGAKKIINIVFHY